MKTHKTMCTHCCKAFIYIKKTECSLAYCSKQCRLDSMRKTQFIRASDQSPRIQPPEYIRRPLELLINDVLEREIYEEN